MVEAFNIIKKLTNIHTKRKQNWRSHLVCF